MENSSRLETLQTFFADECVGRARGTQARYERVHQHLILYLDEADVSFCLGTHPAALLEAERQFAPGGAFLRLFGFEELVCCIPEFLSDTWLLPGPSDARTQISLIDRMLRWLTANRLFDRYYLGCAYWDAEAAIKRARRRAHNTSASVDDPWDPATRARLGIER